MQAAGRGEHWWPVAAAILVAAGLHVALPVSFNINTAGFVIVGMFISPGWPPC